MPPRRRLQEKQPPPPPPPARRRLTKKTAPYDAPPSSHPSKASNSNIPALQMARMEAAYKMKAAGDTEREKLYTDQWVKGGPNRRLTTKSAPRAQNAAPTESIVNQRTAKQLSDIVLTARRGIYGLPPEAPHTLIQALLAKDIAKKAEKRGMSAAQSASVATIVGLGLQPSV